MVGMPRMWWRPTWRGPRGAHSRCGKQGPQRIRGWSLPPGTVEKYKEFYAEQKGDRSPTNRSADM